MYQGPQEQLYETKIRVKTNEKILPKMLGILGGVVIHCSRLSKNI